MAAPAATPPALLEATRNSTSAWQDDLQALFVQARERFPDVVWELSDSGDAQNGRVEEIWGHKGAFTAACWPTARSMPVDNLLDASKHFRAELRCLSPAGGAFGHSALFCGHSTHFWPPSPARSPHPSPHCSSAFCYRCSNRLRSCSSQFPAEIFQPQTAWNDLPEPLVHIPNPVVTCPVGRLVGHWGRLWANITLAVPLSSRNLSCTIRRYWKHLAPPNRGKSDTVLQ